MKGPNTEERKKRMTHIKEALNNKGLKVTHQRIEIFNEVIKSDDHPDVETIYRGVRERLPTVSLDTIYRTLWLLIDMGLIAALGPSRERVRFDGNTEPHHHFVCTRCRKIYDFYSPEFDRIQLPEEIQSLGEGEKINVEVRGVCHQCMASSQ
ncbi:MAG: transcriptional repressor [Deltaproteobacteria bacterium]|nr:transcriptional repressor [Deltaproteobacteria bacterium]